MSDTEVILWQNTNRDIQTHLSIKLGFEQARSVQDFQTLAKVVSSAFGGSSEENDVPEPANKQQALAQFKAVFGGG